MECLITKLKGVVDDSSLLKLGELRIKKTKVSEWNGRTQSFVISASENMDISIVGDGYFTDETGAENKGKTLSVVPGINSNVYFSNGDFYISIPNKYAITRFNFTSAPSSDPTDNDALKSKSFDASLLNYTQGLAYLSAVNTGLYGDASNWNFPLLENLYLSSDITSSTKALGKSKSIVDLNIGDCSNISGDISEFSDLSLMVNLAADNTALEGNISALSNLTDLKSISLSKTNVYGDLSSLSKLTKLTRLLLIGTSVTGSVDSLSSLNSLTVLSLSSTKISGGDLSKLPVSLPFFTCKNNADAHFTWSSTRSSSAKILALEAAELGSDIDTMLINQADCQIGYTGYTDSWYKVIQANGTRTSASDSAISTLQSKGYTVTVPEATNANSISLMSVNSISETYRIAYKNKELIVEPTTLQIYPASDISVKEFSSLEEANAYVSNNGLVRTNS